VGVSDIHSRSSVARVIRQFKDRRTSVEKYHGESSDFRSLCEDYAICERALERWQASDAAMAAQRLQEYTELLMELREEILAWLDRQHIQEQSIGKSGSIEPSNS